MQPTSQFRSVCLTEQRHYRGTGSQGAGVQPGYSFAFEGRTEFYKPYKMLPEAMNEIIAAMWIILTDRFLTDRFLACVCVCIEGDRFLACVCVGVCVCVCVLRATPDRVCHFPLNTFLRVCCCSLCVCFDMGIYFR